MGKGVAGGEAVIHELDGLFEAMSFVAEVEAGRAAHERTPRPHLKQMGGRSSVAAVMAIRQDCCGHPLGDGIWRNGGVG
jgi:hypothetical protein